MFLVLLWFLTAQWTWIEICLWLSLLSFLDTLTLAAHIVPGVKWWSRDVFLLPPLKQVSLVSLYSVQLVLLCWGFSHCQATSHHTSVIPLLLESDWKPSLAEGVGWGERRSLSPFRVNFWRMSWWAMAGTGNALSGISLPFSINWTSILYRVQSAQKTYYSASLILGMATWLRLWPMIHIMIILITFVATEPLISLRIVF